MKQLRDDGFIANKLVPKARDSYTFLHLMERDRRPMTYVVIMALEACPTVDAAVKLYKVDIVDLNDVTEGEGHSQAYKPLEEEHGHRAPAAADNHIVTPSPLH